MVSVQSKPVAFTAGQERAIYDLLFSRGALTAGQVASAVSMDASVVESFLSDKASRRVIDFDPRFNRYATFE